MRPLGERLHAEGYTVQGILLPGHGSQIEDLCRVTSKDWIQAVESALLHRYQENNAPIFLVGLSMGGLLALHLSMKHREKVQAVAVLATPTEIADWRARYLLPIIRYIPFIGLLNYHKRQRDISVVVPNDNPLKIPLKSLFAFLSLLQQVRQRLHKVTVPVLVIHSKNDHTIPVRSAYEIYRKVASKRKHLVILEKSYHVISADCEIERVSKEILDFFDSIRR